MVRQSKPNLIDYITQKKSLTQADLARELGVSRAQITKWKAGEHLPSDRQIQLFKLAGLFATVSEDWAMFAETQENAAAWYSYFSELLEDIEWGDSLRDLSSDAPDIYFWHVLDELLDMGADIQATAPKSHWENEEEYERTPLSACLFDIFETWGQLYDWMDTTLEFSDVNETAEFELFDLTQDLRWIASGLAIEDLEPSMLTAIGCDPVKIAAHIEQSRSQAADRLAEICSIRAKHGLSITADYFQLLTLPPIDLGEASWFRPKADSRHAGEAIKAFLSYSDQQLLAHQECQAMMLQQIDSKLDQLLFALKQTDSAK
jgi:transcriptional regulator with XRE-family HTH domain